MLRFVMLIGALSLAFFIVALADCLAGDDKPRKLSRGWWAIIIVMLPFIGPILWFSIGREKKSNQPKPQHRPRQTPLAPDDDPEFLNDLRRKIREENGDR